MGDTWAFLLILIQSLPPFNDKQAFLSKLSGFYGGVHGSKRGAHRIIICYIRDTGTAAMVDGRVALTDLPSELVTSERK